NMELMPGPASIRTGKRRPLSQSPPSGAMTSVAIIHEGEARRRAALSGSAALATDAIDDLMQTIASAGEERALAMLEAEPALARACDRNGWTPLDAAAGARSQRLIEWLLDHGAEVNRRGPHDRTPLDNAIARRWTAADPEALTPIAELLRRHGAQLTARSAVALGHESWLRGRHMEGALTNPIEDWGGLLTVAVLYDQPVILKLL